MPFENFIYLGDSGNAPYGEKPVEEIVSLTVKNVEFLFKQKCKIIVIACNTATGAAIHFLRNTYPGYDFVGLEPAVKPACLASKTGNIGVLATEGTFKAQHFRSTSEKYAEYIHIHTQPGYGLVNLVEQDMIHSPEAESLLQKYISPLREKNIDYLVLGCTHFPFFKKTIQQICGDEVAILDSGEAVARRTKDILMTKGLMKSVNNLGFIRIITTGDVAILQSVAGSYLEIDQANYNFSHFDRL